MNVFRRHLLLLWLPELNRFTLPFLREWVSGSSIYIDQDNLFQLFLIAICTLAPADIFCEIGQLKPMHTELVVAQHRVTDLWRKN